MHTTVFFEVPQGQNIVVHPLFKKMQSTMLIFDNRYMILERDISYFVSHASSPNLKVSNLKQILHAYPIESRQKSSLASLKIVQVFFFRPYLI